MPALYWPVDDRPRTSDRAAFSGNWLNLGRAALGNTGGRKAPATWGVGTRRRSHQPPDRDASRPSARWRPARRPLYSCGAAAFVQTRLTSATGKRKGRPESGGLLIHFVKSCQVLIGAASSSPRRIFASVAKVLLGSDSRSVQILVAAALFPAA